MQWEGCSLEQSGCGSGRQYMRKWGQEATFTEGHGFRDSWMLRHITYSTVFGSQNNSAKWGPEAPVGQIRNHRVGEVRFAQIHLNTDS